MHEPALKTPVATMRAELCTDAEDAASAADADEDADSPAADADKSILQSSTDVPMLGS